jgi:molybdopterin synthase sulfur carrier subunit
MNIQLRFFASIREALGTSHETLALPSGVGTVGELRAFLRERGDAWAVALAPGRALRMACNQLMADEATPLTEGCEVAFFPPVTGG